MGITKHTPGEAIDRGLADDGDVGAIDVARLDRNTLVEAHLHLVDHVVNQVAMRFPRHVDREELRAAGAAGLVDAAHRFDPSAEVPFARYASIRIRGAVIDASRTRDWATRRMRRDLRMIEAARHRLQERLHRVPADAEIAREVGMDEAHVRRQQAAQLTSTLLTLDRPVGTDGNDGPPLADQVVEEHVEWLPETAVERSELVGTLHHAVASLPDELRRVLTAHHFEGRLLRDIADEFGVTEARASQLRHEALRALQAYFATLFDDVAPVPDDAPGKRRRASYVAQARATDSWRDRIDGDRVRAAYASSEAWAG